MTFFSVCNCWKHAALAFDRCTLPNYSQLWDSWKLRACSAKPRCLCCTTVFCLQSVPPGSAAANSVVLSVLPYLFCKQGQQWVDQPTTSAMLLCNGPQAGFSTAERDCNEEGKNTFVTEEAMILQWLHEFLAMQCPSALLIASSSTVSQGLFWELWLVSAHSAPIFVCICVCQVLTMWNGKKMRFYSFLLLHCCIYIFFTVCGCIKNFIQGRRAFRITQRFQEILRKSTYVFSVVPFAYHCGR